MSPPSRFGLEWVIFPESVGLGLGQSEGWESDCASIESRPAAGKGLQDTHPCWGSRRERREDYHERCQKHPH